MTDDDPLAPLIPPVGETRFLLQTPAHAESGVPPVETRYRCLYTQVRPCKEIYADRDYWCSFCSDTNAIPVEVVSPPVGEDDPWRGVKRFPCTRTLIPGGTQNHYAYDADEVDAALTLTRQQQAEQIKALEERIVKLSHVQTNPVQLQDGASPEWTCPSCGGDALFCPCTAEVLSLRKRAEALAEQIAEKDREIATWRKEFGLETSNGWQTAAEAAVAHDAAYRAKDGARSLRLRAEQAESREAALRAELKATLGQLEESHHLARKQYEKLHGELATARQEVETLKQEQGKELVEPETVVHWNCPNAPPQDSLEGVPIFNLRQVLNDVAGRQRRYVCPACAAEITVDFPPASEQEQGTTTP